jgi:glutamyl-tRNA reductase
VAFLLVTFNDEHAPIELLEKMTIARSDLSRVLLPLTANANVDGAVVVSTCQRTEVYASIGRFHEALAEIYHTLSRELGVEEEVLRHYGRVEYDRNVVQHLFEVAAGLHSVVPGEFEVLGQLRDAAEQAATDDVIDPMLREVFQRALSAGRLVREQTGIARGTMSFSQVGVDLIGELVPDIAGATIAVVGAGELAKNLVTALATQLPAVGEIQVFNRTLTRAEAIGPLNTDVAVTPRPLSALASALSTARVVVSAVSAGEPIVSVDNVADRDTNLLAIDFGMPRTIDPRVAGRAGVTLVDMTSLRERVDATIAQRHGAFREARSLITQSMELYFSHRRSRSVAAVVSDFRRSLESQRELELARRANVLATFSAEQLALVDELTRAMVAKIAHQPSLVIKDTAGTERGDRLVEAVRLLFNLEGETELA